MTAAKSTYQLVEENHWLTQEGRNYLRLRDCKTPHELFERVFLNVSASAGKDWRDLYGTNPRNRGNMSLLIVCLNLIDEHLYSVFGMTERQRASLLGRKHYDILAKYLEHRRLG
jgi:hypothetical protein